MEPIIYIYLAIGLGGAMVYFYVKHAVKNQRKKK
jgi:hypothetical protein